MENSKKRWGRRVAAAIAWAVLAYGSTYLQPVLNLNAELLTLVVQTSREIVLILILGLSATDFIAIKGNK